MEKKNELFSHNTNLWGCDFIVLAIYKMARGEIDKKRFHAYFISSALVGFLSILISILFLNFINSLIDITNFINSYGILIASIAGGYLMNFFTFVPINKKWNDLQKF